MRARLGTAGYSGGTLLIKSSAISPCATRTTAGRSASTGLIDLSPDGASGRIPPGASPTTPSAGPIFGSVKLTITVVSTSTGAPFSKYGLYFHCLTASRAAGGGRGGR